MGLAKRKAEPHYTYADAQTWEGPERYELYEGEAVMLAAPSSLHQLVSMELARQIANFLHGKPCRIFPAPFDVRLFATAEDSPEDVDTVVEPDLSVVCDPEKIDRYGCRGAPDLVIEILSPATRHNDRIRKFELYQRAGVREYWIADPDMGVVMVHTLEEGRYHGADAYTRRASVPSQVLEGCVVDLSTVFPAPEEGFPAAE